MNEVTDKATGVKTRAPTVEIPKDTASTQRANLKDYTAMYASFDWQQARNALDGLPHGALNIAHEAVERHVQAGNGNRVAIRAIANNESHRDMSYQQLSDESNRFASVLRELGVRKGERVYSLLGRTPEMFVSVMGTLKAGCVYCPLFTAFGPEPILSRLQIGDARVLVTTRALYRRKVADIRERVPDLRAVLLVDGPEAGAESDELRSLPALMAAASSTFDIEPTRPNDSALLHFTSGTTGLPKGALHVHEAVVAHHFTGSMALDMRVGDRYWCTADPGWVTGTSYGVIAPLTHGLTLIVDAGEFDAQRWYRILERERVNVWYTAPTAIRMLMKAGDELPIRHDLWALRFMASVGEPLNPEAVIWGERVFGMPFHDNWWQTETGGIMIANYASMPVRPGSMGKPLPGIRAAILMRDDSGVREIVKPMVTGELALRAGWPSMMREYIGEPKRYADCFVGSWYLSGDLAKRDSDGYYWFVGRGDDVIKSSGHLIGPFEVESALMEHEAVAEAGVIGIPEPTAGEVVKAFVVLKPGFVMDEEMRLRLLAHARRTLGPAVAPRQIAFRGSLPKTRSGKIMRRLLKARELGLPEGDISTLEVDES